MLNDKDEGINYLSADYIVTMSITSLGIIAGLAVMYFALLKLKEDWAHIYSALSRFFVQAPLSEDAVEEREPMLLNWLPAIRRAESGALSRLKIIFLHLLIGSLLLIFSIEGMIDVNLATDKGDSDSEELANPQEMISFSPNPLIQPITLSSPAPVATAINNL